ncbi:MAG: hypothetical protein WBF34_25405 [Streptosporangiaceae bacterium]
MRGISGLFTRGHVILTVAAVVAAVAGGGTALALTTSASSHVVSMSTAGRTSAALKVTAGTPVLKVSVGKLGGTLLRVSTPDDAPVRPVLAGSRLIVLSLTGAAAAPGRGSGYAVKVVLNSAVTWSLDLAGGTQRTEADLRGGKVGGIAVTAGSDILDVSLPKPAGTLPFLLAGGASQFLLSLPGGVPAQVTVGGGASFVSVDDQNLTGVAGGTVLTPPGWATATSRFDIDATSGFSRLTVSRWYPVGS